jgi:hypothetical protein
MRRPSIGTAHASPRLLLTGAALLLAACTTLPLKPLPPKVEFVGVRVGRLQLADMQLRVMVDAYNPNAYALRVDAIDAEIRVNGELLASAALPAPVTLAPAATSRVDLDLRTGLDRLVVSLGRLPPSGPIPYEITGLAVVQDGWRLPFARRGELPAAAWTPGGGR